jgi:RimJ/RimL family protein N-acetyltransferase
MVPDVRIETRRLIFRPPQRDDSDAWALMEADESVKASTGSIQDQRESSTQRLSIAGHWAITGWGSLCATGKERGRFVGRFGPSKPFGWPCVEVGWMLLPEFQGKGLAPEGAVAATDFAFPELGEPRVIHTVPPWKVASQKLAEQLG